MYISSIKFNQDIVFNSTRPKNLDMFKIKTRSVTENNFRRPIYDTKNCHRRIGYEKLKYKLREFIIFEKDLTINFSNLTIIVGDNGSGKSTLLKYLNPPDFSKSFSLFSDKTDEERYQEKFDKWINNENRSISINSMPEYFIFEKQIHKNHFIDNIGKGKMILSAEEISMKFNMSEDSNGETTIDFITSLKDIENCLIVLDEPETSLSIKSQIKMSKIIKHLMKTNQVIIVTHSPVFMNLSKTVYDFEIKEYVKTAEYINSQYK